MSKDTGLVLKLSEEFPTVIQIGGQEVKVYALRLESGQLRTRFVADRSVKIIGPTWVKKGRLDEEVNQSTP